MIRAAWEKTVKWWDEVGSQKAASALVSIGTALDEWWGDLADHPRSHFITVILFVVLACSIKLGAWLVA